jgi:hypothetical protein
MYYILNRILSWLQEQNNDEKHAHNDKEHAHNVKDKDNEKRLGDVQLVKTLEHDERRVDNLYDKRE